jgi:hypothetical protein
MNTTRNRKSDGALSESREPFALSFAPVDWLRRMFGFEKIVFAGDSILPSPDFHTVRRRLLRGLRKRMAGRNSEAGRRTDQRGRAGRDARDPRRGRAGRDARGPRGLPALPGQCHPSRRSWKRSIIDHGHPRL